MRTIPALFATLCAALAAGCGPIPETTVPDLSDESEIRVVTTIGMIADAVRNVGGPRVRVEALMGPGIDPHLYKASEGDVRRLERADVIFYGGLHLEAKMADVLERIGERRLTRAVTDGIPRDRLLDAGGGQHDPHVWFDVKLWQGAVREVRDTLATADPAHAAGYRARAARYLAELDALDAEARAKSARVPRAARVIVTAHDAFSYFGRAYGFDVVGLQGISTASEAGTKDVRRLAELIASRRIPALFVETSVSPRTIEAVQEAVRARGFEVTIGGSLFSDAMGSAGTPEGTYVGMVRHNVDAITTALGAASP